MKRKVLDICLDGLHLVCVRISGDKNPFRLYRVSNGHRMQIAKYGDFLSVIIFIKDMYIAGADTFTTPVLREWSAEYHKQ